MRCEIDYELRGNVMIYDSMMEVLEVSEEANERNRKIAQERKKNGIYDSYSNRILYDTPKHSEWHDLGEQRKFNSWDDMKRAVKEPWEEGIKKVNTMLEELHAQNLPTPKSRKRKARWSEVDGDIDVERVMQGEPEFMRLVKRDMAHGPTAVALLCNLDAYAGDTPETVFWRGAAATAAADLLEEQGYLCEIWMWCAGTGVYKKYPNQFNTCCFKHAGDPIDINSLINGLSSWFCRFGLFGSFLACTTDTAKCYGRPDTTLGKWRKWMEITEGVLELEMPFVTTKQEAMEGAKKILQTVIDTYSGQAV